MHYTSGSNKNNVVENIMHGIGIGILFLIDVVKF